MDSICVFNWFYWYQLNKLCPYMGTIYPCFDHYLSKPEIFNKDSYLAVIVGTTEEGNILENFVFRKKFWHYSSHWRVLG